jgi:hypothetical protein
LIQTKYGNSQRLFEANTSILQLYSDAYARIKGSPLPKLESDVFSKEVVLEVSDSSGLLSLGSINEWTWEKLRAYERNNFYCYELMLPDKFTLYEAYQFMIQDLDRYFKFKSSIEIRPVKCLQLVIKDQQMQFKSDSGKMFIALEDGRRHLQVSKLPIWHLVTSLNIRFDYPWITNETGYDGYIDVDLHLDENLSLLSLRKELQKFGLDLREKIIKKPMLVIRDAY